MKITIVGTGHGGSAAAATLSQDGHDISLLKLSDRPDEHFAKMEENLEIELRGIEGRGRFPLEKVSRDPAEVIPKADVIFIFYVSNYHKQVVAALAPHLQENQVVYICPGYLGSVIFMNELKRLDRKRHAPLFVEGETLPYSCRITAPGKVKIYSKNYGHPIATLPAPRIEEATSILTPLIGNCIERDHIVEVALHNPNLIMHTVGIALNAAYIENSDGRFSMYTEGFTPSTWKVANELDAEKKKILKHLGVKPRSYIDEFKVRTFENPEAYNEEEAFEIYADSVRDLYTESVKNRYITEDVPVGLGLIHSFGKHLGIPTPVADSIITLAGTMVDDDYFIKARTIEFLGYRKVTDLFKDITSEKQLKQLSFA